jgi:hypothetical protein
MSEQNKDRLNREDWLKSSSNAMSEPGSDAPSLSDQVDSWEQRALRGRALLENEQEAEAILEDLDSAIEEKFGSTAVEQLEKKKRVIPVWLSVAAGALILILSAWWLWFGSKSPEQLYTQYFTPLENDLSVSLMGAETDNSALAISLKHYSARRYGEAVFSIGQYLKMYPENQALRVYYGISLMETGAVTEAIKQFETIDKKAISTNYQQAIDWYLSLAYLKANQPEKAKQLLQKISDQEHPYAQKAITLAKEL